MSEFINFVAYQKKVHHCGMAMDGYVQNENPPKSQNDSTL